MRNLVIPALALLALCAVPGAAKPAVKPKPLPPVVKRAVNAIMAGDPKPLKNDLTAQMAQVLTKDVLQATKKQYVAPLGPLVSVRIASTTKTQGMNVTVFVMHLKKGDLTGQMAQDASGKVAGLYVRPGSK